MSPTKTQTLQPIPYLSFDGNCAEAMHFYEKTLGGTIKVMMSGSQVPVQDEMAMVAIVPLTCHMKASRE